MISLADLRARGVTPTWQEAVAVVQELLQTVVAAGGPIDRLPDLEHIALIPNGDVVALPGSLSGENPVRHLGSLLSTLLEGSNPPAELTALADKAMATPGQFASVEEFSNALAFFERPGRHGDVERLVSRSLAAEAQSRADEELRRLKEKAADAANRTPLDETLMMARPKRRSAVPAIAAVLVLALAVAGAVWYRSRPVPATIAQPQASPSPSEKQPPAEPSQAAGQPQPAGPTPSGAQTPTAGQPAAGLGQPGQTPAASQPPASKGLFARAADAIRSAVDAVIPPAKEAAPKAEITVAEAPKSKPKASHARHASTSTPAPAPPPPVAPPTGEITSVSTEPITDAEPASVATVTAAPARAVYTSVDEAVMPPVMIRPVLPTVPPPGISPDQVGTLELIIDETGSVEQVKLTSPTNRYQERMLVSHAKSWKFKPALRDGQPVKYRTRVRVTI